MEARQKAEYYKNRDILTGLMSYACFKDECQKIMDAGQVDMSSLPVISRDSNSLTRQWDTPRGTISCACLQTC